MKRLEQYWKNFCQRLTNEGVNVHSLLFGHKDKIIFQESVEELDGDGLHRQFSISKSFTSMAIGLLEEEGKLRIEDRLIKYYPEYADLVSELFMPMTIRDLLAMETCHAYTTYKKDPSKPWVESFFITEGHHMPGSSFIYDTSASHVLGHLVEKLSGQKVLDYLRSKGLDKTGFSADAYFLEDPQGHVIAGSGLMARAEDIYIFTAILQQKGQYRGQQIFPEAYCEAAVAKQTDTQLSASLPEGSYGYGYQIWRHRKGWYLNGMGGQYGIVVDGLDWILVTTADMQTHSGLSQAIFDAYFDEIITKLEVEDIAPIEDEKRITRHTWNLPRARSTYPETQTYTGIYGEHEEVTIQYGPDNLSLRLRGFAGDLDINLREDEQREVLAPISNYHAYASYGAIGPGRFLIWIQVVDSELGSLRLEGQVTEDYVQMKLLKNMERFHDAWEGSYLFYRHGSN